MSKTKYDLSSMLIVQLTRANSLLSIPIDRAFKANGFSVAASRVLAVLGENDAQTIGDISAITALKQPSVTRAVEQLEKTDMVFRKRDPEDGRIVLVYLTKKGRQTNEEQMEQVHKIEERQLAGYSEEQKQLLTETLDNLITHLKGNN